MQWSDTDCVPADVIMRQLGDEAVILDLARGMYFGLDPVGTRIWQLIEAGQTLQQVRDSLLDEYDASREQIERDLMDLLLSLRERGLIQIA